MTVVETLTQEDLIRWRNAAANYELTTIPIPGVSPTEAKTYIMDYFRIMGEFFTTYNIPPQNMDKVAILPFTGHIILDD